jgi:hypothetical protein
MTFEHKIVVGLDDIKAVTFECRKCHARLTVSPEKIQIPDGCPNCPNSWISGEKKSFQSDTSQQTNFVDALAKIRVLEGSGAPFKIFLEFNDMDRKPL